MAVFSYVYYWSYISEPEVTVGGVLALISKLSDHDQVLLLGKLCNLLTGEGLIPGACAMEVKRKLCAVRLRVFDCASVWCN
jgi:phosphatidate cytidylyltransferase